ncbi:hypothetical protein JAAARDRAFT_681267 [Jaapia argillacea MUCL 33604]|uniref:Uncharacterized protein n=1 Tax=Jaapia argillacea MUCL 33604 TaxID=933084 RepID=A0A067PF92_9AGAM|nr:hypothetical protein JAAARDRAFT_681267 [Jaapia argillacea MUCL 33604]
MIIQSTVSKIRAPARDFPIDRQILLSREPLVQQYLPTWKHHRIPGGDTPILLASCLMVKCSTLYNIMIPFWDDQKLCHVKSPSGTVIGKSLSETEYEGLVSLLDHKAWVNWRHSYPYLVVLVDWVVSGPAQSKSGGGQEVENWNETDGSKRAPDLREMCIVVNNRKTRSQSLL